MSCLDTTTITKEMLQFKPNYFNKYCSFLQRKKKRDLVVKHYFSLCLFFFINNRNIALADTTIVLTMFTKYHRQSLYIAVN